MRWLGSIVLTLVAIASARADDRWTEPYPGVRYLERTTTAPANRVFAVSIDLSRPEIVLHATRRADRGRTVTAFATAYHVAIAVNGDFFKDGFVTEGLAMGAREPWAGSADGTKWSFVAAGDNNRVIIPLPQVAAAAEPWMSEIVGGYPLLVDQGAALAFPDCTTSFCRRNPRTLVGLDRDGKTLILVVVDGRTSRSVGMSFPEAAALMVELGAWRALNFDGGGSSAMYLEAEGGVVNVPSDGNERRVANHLGISVGVAPAGVDAGVPSPPDAGLQGPADAGLQGPADAGLAPADGEVGGGCAVAPQDGGEMLAGLLLCAWLLARRRLGCMLPESSRESFCAGPTSKATSNPALLMPVRQPSSTVRVASEGRSGPVPSGSMRSIVTSRRTTFSSRPVSRPSTLSSTRLPLTGMNILVACRVAGSTSTSSSRHVPHSL